MPLISSICFLFFFCASSSSTSLSSSSSSSFFPYSPSPNYHYYIIFFTLYSFLLKFTLLVRLQNLILYYSVFASYNIPFKFRPSILCYLVREPIHIQALLLSSPHFTMFFFYLARLIYIFRNFVLIFRTLYLIWFVFVLFLVWYLPSYACI